MIDLKGQNVLNIPFQETEVPLVVDIDGSLLKTDLLYEAMISLIRKNPIQFLKCLPSITKGKVFFKNNIFRYAEIDYKNLPYNEEILQFCSNEFLQGRKLVLATASPLKSAIEISKLFPMFSEVYGTEDKVNVKGRNKLKILIDRFGKGKFDYIGNSKADKVIFSSSRNSYLVNPLQSVEKKTKKIANLTYTWHSERASLKDYIKEIRAYQWIKNILIFVPLITAHLFFSMHAIVLTTIAFFIFSMVASSGYLLNDILDVQSDRIHPKKRDRAIASGKMSIPNALLLGILFLSSGLYFAISMNVIFFYTLLFYFIVSFLYSFFLKKMVLYDVFVLAMLYSIRVFAGSLVVNVPLSFWLISFSTFIFLSLAFLKRYSELISLTDKDILKKQSRGYYYEDKNLVQGMGIASGFLAIVVFALYINSNEVMVLYSRPKVLWPISFLLLFWIGRIWLFTTRGKMTDDPIVFSLKDITSYFVFLLCGILMLAAL